MQPQFSIGTKPSNAGWRAKVDASASGVVEVTPDPRAGEPPHVFDRVQIAWYDDAIKVTVRKAGPAQITQAYLPGQGQDVILELKPA